MYNSREINSSLWNHACFAYLAVNTFHISYNRLVHDWCILRIRIRLHAVFIHSWPVRLDGTSSEYTRTKAILTIKTNVDKIFYVLNNFLCAGRFLNSLFYIEVSLQHCSVFRYNNIFDHIFTARFYRARNL